MCLGPQLFSLGPQILMAATACDVTLGCLDDWEDFMMKNPVIFHVSLCWQIQFRKRDPLMSGSAPIKFELAWLGSSCRTIEHV